MMGLSIDNSKVMLGINGFIPSHIRKRFIKNRRDIMNFKKYFNFLLSVLVITTMLLGGVGYMPVNAQDVNPPEGTPTDVPTVKPTSSSVPNDLPTVEPSPTSSPAVDPSSNTPAVAKSGGDNSHGHVTPAERQAAAARSAAAREAGLQTEEEMSAEASPSMNPGGTPDYFGATPNYANSPLPASIGIVGDGTDANAIVTLTTGGVVAGVTVTNGGSDYTDAATTAMVIGGGGTGAILNPVIAPITGTITSINVVNGGSGYNTVLGIRKFVDALPGLGEASANLLGQYIPVAVPDTTTYPGSDYYEIALIQYTEQLHSDLSPTTLRGYVQISTSVVPGKHITLQYPDGSPMLDTLGGQVYAVDNPQYLGPTIVAGSYDPTKAPGLGGSGNGQPTRIKFTNYLPTGSGGDLFIPVDTTVMGAGMGPTGELTGITILSGGSGYTIAPIVTITGPGGSGTTATAEATILNGVVNVIHITNPGSDYTALPGITISAPGGAGITATASLSFIGADPENYSQNRATLHLHGGNTPWISDGTPHQWTTPAGETTSYPEGVSVYNVPDMPDPGPGSMTFFYTNEQSARLMFYHDHAYGITRLDVYSGEAAGYLVTDPVEQALVSSGVIPPNSNDIPLIIQDKTFVPSVSQLAVEDPTWNWGSAPLIGGVRAPVVGDLWFPHVYMPNQNPFDPMGVNAVGRWDYGPWFWPPFNTIEFGEVPNPLYPSATNPMEGPNNPGTPNPSIVPEGYMDTPLVNGTPYPYLNVTRQAYRFRILNASNDRMLNLQLYCAKSNDTMWSGTTLLNANAGEVNMVPAVQTAGFPATWPTDGRAGGVPDPAAVGPSMIQIGTEGGLLPAPAVIPNQPVGYLYDRRNIVVLNVSTHALMLGPAERADVIIDFSQVLDSCSNLILYNDSPAPVPAFDPRNDYYTGDPDNTGIGGAPSTMPGYGPNTRTIMQIRVSGAVGTAYNLTALQSALPTAFAASQPAPLVPQAAYNAAYGANYPTDAYARIQDKSLAFTPAGITTINTIKVTAGGAGYMAAPLLSFTGGTPTTSATATANVDGNGTVTSIIIINPGVGYSSAPVVNITGGAGSGAKATATVTGGVVTAITVTNGGFGYAPKVTLVDGTGTGATATATVANLPGSGATATATITSGIVDNTILITNGGSGYTSAPVVIFTGGGSPTTVATGTATIAGGHVTAITVTNGGAGYTSPPTVNIVNGIVTAVTVTNGGSGYTSAGVPSVVISGGGPGGGAPKTPAAATASTAVTVQLQPKAIQELFTLDYGRMNATMGVEVPSTNGTNQTTIPYGYIDPPTEIVMSTPDALTPIGTMADGTQLWKITHNGVDTHAIHFHMFNVQLINRVGWDGMIRPPDPNEVGWKETIRMNPLEDAIIALRPIVPIIPFTIGNSTRPLDVTQPIGSSMGFWGQDPLGNPTTILNQMVNYGWEYVWHCHLLGHEENDMMRPMVIAIPPDASTLLATASSSPPLIFTWDDNSTNATSFTLQRATDPAFTMNLTTFKVAKTPGILQTYTDTTAHASTLYYYQVVTNNEVGGIVGVPTEPSMTAVSAPSNIVKFPSNLFYLTLISPHGAVVKNPDQPSYNSSTTVELTAAADAGWTFTGWSGDASGAANPLTPGILMNADKTVTANYLPSGGITISGKVSVAGGVTPLPGVTLSYVDVTPQTTTTASDGTYAITVSAGWTGTVTPTMTGYTFAPANRNYITPGALNLTLQNYTATANLITISGTVTLIGGSVGLAGVTMSFTGATITDMSGMVNTNASGIYSFTVLYGWSGTVTPVKTGYNFIPVNLAYTSLIANQTFQNYTAGTFTIYLPLIFK
jgi:FtsP/CotA-like multicopper oxidase with cupredoxin domain